VRAESSKNMAIVSISEKLDIEYCVLIVEYLSKEFFKT
jgi:hypothetical protein